MEVKLCYNLSSVTIKWNIPFFPRIGESISVSEIISERKNDQLCKNQDYFIIKHIAWFPANSSSASLVEIILE